MSAPYPCIEALIEFSLANWEFRLWLSQEDLTPLDPRVASDILTLIRDRLDTGPTPSREDLADFIASSVANLAAVQVRDTYQESPRLSTVVYREWP